VRSSTGTRARLYYDRDCGFCRWALAWVLRLDRAHALEPLPIQSPEGDRDLGDLGEARMESWHLTRGGERFSGGVAFAPLLEELRPLRFLAPAARRAEFLSVPVYRWIAKHRDRASKLVPARSKARADAYLRARS
jgi:predicted DCC family thiol-disulfide oxidoreductase YuxK